MERNPPEPAQPVTVATRSGVIAGYVALFGSMYAAFGVASPFLPSLMESRGIPPEQIGLIFALATAARLLSSPLAGTIADRFRALRLMLAVSAVGTAAAVLGYIPAEGFFAILAVSILHAVFLAPVANLADALAQSEMRRSGSRRFHYGWARGAGSAAFVAGSLIAGVAISSFGLPIIVVMQAALMLLVPAALLTVRQPPPDASAREPSLGSREDVFRLMRTPGFLPLVAVAAMILGSHAMHDTFSAIRWRQAGISAPTISVLWSVAVAAEVVVFLLAGPALLARINPVRALQTAAVIAAVRWVVSVASVDLWIILLAQPMHGITFALLHLAAMRLLAQIVPNELAATSQALYGTVGIGLASVVMTFVAGWLVASLGYQSFLLMAALALASLPLTSAIRRQLPKDA